MKIRVLAVIALCLARASGGIPDAMHPDFDLKIVPLAETYKTMGLGFLSDGRMVLATSEFIGWGEVPKAPGEDRKVLIVTDPGGPHPTVKEVANDWLQPVGLTIVGDTVYVSDRDGFYRIQSLDSVPEPGRNREKIASWPDTTVWTNGYSWHQFVFTPVYWQGHFYAPYSGSIRPGGYSDVAASNSYSGAFLKWDLSGKLEKVAGGLRSPNGCNINPAGEMFVTDNQGGWLPSSTFMLMKPGKFYGHRQSPTRDAQGGIVRANAPNWAEDLPYERPTAWLDYGAIGLSPSQPVYVDRGTYAGDWLLGDVNQAGLVRIGLDEVDGTYNGCAFWFGKGFGFAAINRLAWGKDGALYVGTLMHTGNWPGGDKTPLYRVAPKFVSAPAFDMRSIRHLADGVEIHFTRPVDPATLAPANFSVTQWNYTRQETYGTGKGVPESRTVTGVEASADGKRVHVKIAGLKEDYVAYFKLGAVLSAQGDSLWNDEAWLTLNRLSSRTWEAVTSLAAPSPAAPAARVHCHTVPGGLMIGLEAPGRMEIALRSLRGAVVAAVAGEGSLLLPTRGLAKGIYLLEARQGGRESLRPLVLP